MKIFGFDQKIDFEAKFKKSLAQEVRQKSDISERSLLCLQHDYWVTVRPVKGQLTTKMNITFVSTN